MLLAWRNVLGARVLFLFWKIQRMEHSEAFSKIKNGLPVREWSGQKYEEKKRIPTVTYRDLSVISWFSIFSFSPAHGVAKDCIFSEVQLLTSGCFGDIVPARLGVSWNNFVPIMHPICANLYPFLGSIWDAWLHRILQPKLCIWFGSVYGTKCVTFLGRLLSMSFYDPESCNRCILFTAQKVS